MFLKKALALYEATTPSLRRLEQIFGLTSGYPIDHVAFRTFKSSGGIASISQCMANEYAERDSYTFPEKKLTSKWFSPKSSHYPRIFVSQLEDDMLSSSARRIIRTSVPDLFSDPNLFYNSIPHTQATDSLVKYTDYLNLKDETEYGAWTLLNGPKLNHIGIGMNVFSGIHNLLGLHHLLEQHGFQICTDGGSIKISDDGQLAQSSIISDELPYHFLGEQHPISVNLPGTFVEFIDRRREGFEASNAFHIFESTTKELIYEKD